MNDLYEGPAVKLVPFRAEDHVPETIVEVLEHALQCAKDGSLRSLTFQYSYDAGAHSEIHEDGSPLVHGGNLKWRMDGDLTRIHSDCHLLAAEALDSIRGE